VSADTRSGSRHRARKRALDVLYEADLKQQPTLDVLKRHLADPEPPGDFAVELVRGVQRHQAGIDLLIETHARDWTLGRMPVVDRNLLRLGAYEILHDPDIPTAVAINEAVELAKELSTEDSGRFINGVLARIAEQGTEG
jgi:transcription antitermination protein NusB